MNSYEESREINPAKVACDWCQESATWKIVEPCSLDGYNNACTAHGREWYPHLFPQGVTLNKTTTGYTMDPLTVRARQGRSILPRYPLMSHRDGLRRNDLVTLASAFWITSSSRLAG